MAKAGTTLLHSWLESHPEVCVPATLKEAEFFDRYYGRGLDWYRGLFRTSTARAAGEFTGTYLHSDAALDRIARDLPHARCLVSVRDPVARLDSEYRDSIRLSGYPHDRRTFIAERPEAVARGLYAGRLEALFRRFPLERVKVFVLEEVVAAPRAAARELYAFVGVDPDFVPPTLHERVNPSRTSVWPPLDRLAFRAYRFSAERDLGWLMRVGRSGPVRRLRGLAAREGVGLPPPMDPALARELRATYAADVEATSRMLGRDLTGLWRMGAG